MKDTSVTTIQKAEVVNSNLPETAHMLLVIADCAKDPNIDIAKMQALKEMRDEELLRIRREQYAADYVQMKTHLPRVIKSKYNGQTKSRYAPLEDVNTVVDPILEEYGFATMTPVRSQTDAHVTVEAFLIHRSGYKESCSVTMPLDNKGPQGTVNKTLVHAISSSISYARRVALCALLNISTGDDQDGATVNENGEPAQKKPKFQEKVEQEEPSYLTAFRKLVDNISKLEKKEDRLKTLNKNLKLIQTLDKEGHQDKVNELHKLVDEGK